MESKGATVWGVTGFSSTPRCHTDGRLAMSSWDTTATSAQENSVQTYKR